MCGEIDEQTVIDEELFERFVASARRHDVQPASAGSDAPTDLSDETVRSAYLDTLFKAGLGRALNDAANLPEGHRMDAVAGQAIAFARLAGFLAGQFPPEADLFRAVVGSMMEGHGEPARNT